MKTVAAFFATATAAAASFVAFGPADPPPPVAPDLLVRYATAPRVAHVTGDGKLAYLVAHAPDGTAIFGAVDLSGRRTAWPAFIGGDFDDTAMVLEITRETVYFLGGDDSSQSQKWTLTAVDPATGQVRWRRDTEQGQVWSQAGNPFLYEENQLTGLDPATGRPRWTLPGADLKIFRGDHRMLIMFPDGVLRVLDAATGAVLHERGGLPVADGNVTLIGDHIYLVAGEQVLRVALTGSAAPEPLLSMRDAILTECGPHLCAADWHGRLVVLDKATGRELWQVRQAGDFLRPAAMQRGILAGSKLYDFAGRDITPPAVAGRTARWLGPDHLMLIRQEAMVSDGTEVERKTRTQVGILDLTTGRETDLGELMLRGQCDGVPGRIVCPEEEGFVLHSY